MTFATARQRVVLFGGINPFGGYGDTWFYGNLTPATTQTVGTPCAGTNGPPVIASNLPVLGSPSFAIDLSSARVSSPCSLVLASATQALPLGGGCTLYLSGVLVPLPSTTSSTGFARTGLSIPFDAALRGAAIYAQALVIDPMGSFAGVAFTAGLKLVLGD
jgi:hypothetical protein